MGKKKKRYAGEYTGTLGETSITKKSARGEGFACRALIGFPILSLLFPDEPLQFFFAGLTHYPPPMEELPTMAVPHLYRQPFNHCG